MAFTQISGNGLKNNSITNAHLHSGANIAASKLADSGVTAGSYGSASLIPAITVNAQGLVTSLSTNSFTTTDNNFTDALLSKLNGIEASATADQTNAEIKTAYEANSDTNAFTDALLSKLNGIAANATNVTNYVTNDASDTLTGGTYTFSSSTAQKIILSGATNPYIRFQEGTTDKAYIQWHSDNGFQLVNQESGEYIQIQSGNFGFKFVVDGTARNVMHSGNVSTYALPIGGGTVTGGLTVGTSTGNLSVGNGSGQARLLLQKADNNISDHIIFYNGTTRVGEIGVEDGSWLRLNQESNTNIYTPRMIRADGGFQVSGATVLHSSNYNSYALPLSGGTLTGDLVTDDLIVGNGSGQTRLFLQKAANNVSDHIIFYNGTARVGEIGVEDGSWLRLNQETASNIYTPRMIRADGGFQVNGSTVVDSNKNLAVPANADLNFANGDWTGNHTKIQLHSHYLYIVGGANGIVFREGGTSRWFVDPNGHFVPNGTGNYNIGNSNNRVNNIYGNALFLGQASRYLSNVNGDYGSIQINGSGAGNYEGFSIDGRVVFMHSGGSDAGIYNDVNNEWMLYTGLNNTSILYFNGAQRVRTEDYGCRIAGTIRPNSTNGGDCGASDARWGTVYASNGSINTSDRNEKNTIIDSDLGLNFINKLKAVSYKWNDEELGEKTHYGLVAQDIEETIKEIGKDVDNIGMIDKPEKGSIGLNYSELIAPLVKAIQELSDKVAALEAA